MAEKATVVNEPMAMQLSESSSCSGLSWNQKRSQARLESSFDSWIKVSLQKCDISDNISKLQGHIAMTNSKKKRQAIFGLIVVFEELSFNGGFLSLKRHPSRRSTSTPIEELPDPQPALTNKCCLLACI